MDALDVHACIEVALADKDLRREAQAAWRGIAGEIFQRNDERELLAIRTSDSGQCVRNLYAAIRNLYDLPETAQGQARMDNGTLVGAWFACLFEAGMRRLYPELRVICEREIEYEGISGHADAIVYTADLETALEVVEFKWSAWTGEADVKDGHRIQAARYALAVGAPRFQVCYYMAAAQKKYDKASKTRLPAQWFIAFPFETSDEAFDVSLEFSRLAQAQLEPAPVGDASEPWRCVSCRWSNCSRNENPLRGKVPA